MIGVHAAVAVLAFLLLLFGGVQRGVTGSEATVRPAKGTGTWIDENRNLRRSSGPASICCLLGKWTQARAWGIVLIVAYSLVADRTFCLRADPPWRAARGTLSSTWAGGRL